MISCVLRRPRGRVPRPSHPRHQRRPRSAVSSAPEPVIHGAPRSRSVDGVRQCHTQLAQRSEHQRSQRSDRVCECVCAGGGAKTTHHATGSAAGRRERGMRSRKPTGDARATQRRGHLAPLAYGGLPLCHTLGRRLALVTAACRLC